MSNNYKNRDDLKKVFTKYKLEEPIPGNIQKTIHERRKRTFRRIFKKIGQYGFFIAFITNLFFGFKKIGFGISFFKAAIVAFVIISVTVATILTGSYYVITKYFFKGNVKKEEIVVQDKIKNKKSTIDKAENKIISKKIRIAYKDFLTEDKTDKNINKITKKIIADIKKLNSNIVFVKYNKTSPVSSILLGSIDKMGNLITINAKLVDSKSSKILFYDSITIENESYIDDACLSLAQKISEFL